MDERDPLLSNSSQQLLRIILTSIIDIGPCDHSIRQLRWYNRLYKGGHHIETIGNSTATPQFTIIAYYPATGLPLRVWGLLLEKWDETKRSCHAFAGENAGIKEWYDSRADGEYGTS